MLKGYLSFLDYLALQQSFNLRIIYHFCYKPFIYLTNIRQNFKLMLSVFILRAWMNGNQMANSVGLLEYSRRWISLKTLPLSGKRSKVGPTLLN